MRIQAPWVGLVVLLSFVARAEQPAPLDAPRVTPGTHVRVTESGLTHTGALRGVQATQLQLAGPGDSWRTFELARVERVEVRRRYTGEGALIGMLVGGLGGGTALGLACRNDPVAGDDVMMINPATCGLAGAGLGGLAGLGLGALVGWSIQSWTTTWSRAPSKP